MVKEKKLNIKPKYCHVCGEKVGGQPGIDWQFVRNGGRDRYYCAKCAEKIVKGE